MKFTTLRRLYRFYDQEGRSLYKLLLIDPITDTEQLLLAKTAELGMRFGRQVFYEEVKAQQRADRHNGF